MNSKPVATLVAVATVALALLVALAGTGVLTGKAAAYLAAAIAVLNLGLGYIAHQKVTPVANPKAADGTPLVPRP
jgi:hypothetical protein